MNWEAARKPCMSRRAAERRANRQQAERTGGLSTPGGAEGPPTWFAKKEQ